MLNQYQNEYNHYYAMLPSAYKEISTLERYIKQRTYSNLYKMQALERCA